MTISAKSAFLSIAAAAFALLFYALHLQYAENMLPCPLCILQRYAFAAVMLVCLVAAFLPPRMARPGAGLGMIAALTGSGTAGWHLWIKAHPATSCGIDPLETSLNQIVTAKLLPFLFRADGFCTTDYEPIFGLSIPQWSLAWFLVFALALGWLALRRAR